MSDVAKSSGGAAPGYALRTGLGPQALAGLALVAMPVGLLVTLTLWPTVRMVGATFSVDGHFSVERYFAFFNDAYTMANLRYTLEMGFVSAIAALSVSFGIALYLRFSAGRIATMIHGLSLFPLFVPSIIISYALVRFLGPNGLFQLMLEQVGFTQYRTPYLTPVGPFLAFVWENLPLPVLVLSAGLSQVSDHAVEAARDLGAKSPRILWEILLPQMRRSLLIAFALIFMGIIGAFTVPYMLGPPAPEMMSVFMQRTLGNLQDPASAQVQAVVLMVISSIVGGFYIATMVKSSAGAR
jgi:ABC-type spermidine/putrescine transport system permease subunit I